MKIVLKKLSLMNFKGIRKYEVEFSDGINEVVGKNGLSPLGESGLKYSISPPYSIS